MRTASLCLAIFLALPSPLLACGNAIEAVLSDNGARRLIAAAEQLIAQGNYQQARQLLERATCFRCNGNESLQGLMEPQPEVSPETIKSYLYQLTRLYATTLLHTGSPRTAVEILKNLTKQRAADPYVQCRLSEAMSLVPEQAAAGRKELEGLSARDLLLDASSYVVLAYARGQAGDAMGRREALAVCQQRAPRKSLCDRAPAKETPKRSGHRLPRWQFN